MRADTGMAQHASAVALDDESLNLLTASVERYGRDKYSFEARKALLGRAPGFSLAAWRDYSEMGWLAAHVPVDAGGFGGDPRAIAALMRYVGEHLVLEPVFATVVLCGGVLAACNSAAARTRLTALAAGGRLYALAHAESLGDGMDGRVDAVVCDGCLTGRKVMVLHGDVADELLVSAHMGASDAIALYALDTSHAGVRRTSLRLLDGRGAASFSFDAVPVTLLSASHSHPAPMSNHAQASSHTPVSNEIPAALAAVADAMELLQAALDHARLALCAEAHGAMRALNRDTLAYLKMRRQFGKPIGTNQVLQHRMTELYMLEQESAAVISAAQRALMGSASSAAQDNATAPGPRTRRAISGAVAHCLFAGRQIAHEAVQMHGGIGITDELAVSHYFKRIMVLNQLLGDRDAHLDAFAAADAACVAAAVGHAAGATGATDVAGVTSVTGVTAVTNPAPTHA